MWPSSSAVVSPVRVRTLHCSPAMITWTVVWSWNTCRSWKNYSWCTGMLQWHTGAQLAGKKLTVLHFNSLCVVFWNPFLLHTHIHTHAHTCTHTHTHTHTHTRSHRVQNCGMNFEWGLFEFTRMDCQLLAQAVKATPTLRRLRLCRSKVDNERGRLLVTHLLDHPSLSLLGKSPNCGDHSRCLSMLQCLLQVSQPPFVGNLQAAVWNTGRPMKSGWSISVKTLLLDTMNYGHLQVSKSQLMWICIIGLWKWEHSQNRGTHFRGPRVSVVEAGAPL